MKLCQSCEFIKDESEFPIRKDKKGILRPYCNECAKDIAKARYDHHRKTNPFLHKVTRARSRSQYLRVPFNLDKEYLESIWTGECPVFNVSIFMNERNRVDEYAAELDRFIPELGYVKGNVTFLSRRANRLKNSASLDELIKLTNWMNNRENQ